MLLAGAQTATMVDLAKLNTFRFGLTSDRACPTLSLHGIGNGELHKLADLLSSLL